MDFCSILGMNMWVVNFLVVCFGLLGIFVGSSWGVCFAGIWDSRD